MDSPRTVTYTATRRSTVRKLTRDELCELVAGYKAGATVYELAEQFKIHRVTVSEVLLVRPTLQILWVHRSVG